jgi:hypothetical protein
MSEFFKALEQAERDRLRQGKGEALSAPPVPRTTPRDDETAGVDSIDGEGEGRRAPVAEVPPATGVAAECSAAEPAAANPGAASSYEAAPASRVFRAPLRTPGERRRVNGRQPLLIAQSDPTSLEAVARAVDLENLSVVVAGCGAQEKPQDVLTAERLAKVFGGSPSAFDLVVVDTPPVMSVADALNVASVCDGVVLVMRAGSVPFSVLRRAVGQIQQVNGRVLGIVVNRVDLRADADYYRHYRTYHAARSRS